MRVCILSDETIEDYNPEVFFHAYEWEFVTVQAPVDKFIQKVSSQKKFDVYLNIFEGSDDNDDSGLKVIQVLEKLNLPFTGADSGFYNPTREQMQEIAQKNGINFARGFHASTVNDLSHANDLQYPLIVKHPNSFASSGLTSSSRVVNMGELQVQFMRNLASYGAARVEEFIEGREVTCLVVDNPNDLAAPFAYLPAEINFPHGESFMHVEVKWLNWDTFIVRLEDNNLVKRVQELSRKMYLAMGGMGYGRVDIRVRPNGELVVLEINPNCGILYYGPDDRSPTDLPISWDPEGHDGFLERIFRSAILRQKMRLAKE